jgi:hypothetical protein
MNCTLGEEQWIKKKSTKPKKSATRSNQSRRLLLQ